MNLAISNIAWPLEQDAAVAELLARHDVRGIEIAPTKIWPAPLEGTVEQAHAFRQTWEDRGFQIIAAQSLLFGQPDLTLFTDEATRCHTLEYLDRVTSLCAALGADALVFGSPKNRRTNGQPPDVIQPLAVDFFTRLAEIAARHKTAIVLEANPPQYGADFVTRASEALALVQQVNHPGLRLHLDTACMTLAEDPVEDLFTAGAPWLHHFHISEPNLAPIGQGNVDHARFARAVRSIGYDSWHSIEMKMVEPFELATLEQAILVARQHYA